MRPSLEYLILRTGYHCFGSQDTASIPGSCRKSCVIAAKFQLRSHHAYRENLSDSRSGDLLRGVRSVLLALPSGAGEREAAGAYPYKAHVGDGNPSAN